MLAPRWRKIIRDLWANKSRTLLVVLSIAIGVLAFSGLFVAQTIAVRDLDSQYRTINSANLTISLPRFDDQLVRWAARQDQVADAQGRAVYGAELIANGVTHDLTLHAIEDYADFRIGRVSPESGAWPPSRDEILIERSTVQLFGGTIGQTVFIELANDERFDVTFAGTIHDLNAPSGALQPQVTGYVTFRTLARFGLPNTFNRLEITVDDGLTSAELADLASDLQQELRRLGFNVSGVQVNGFDEHWASDIINGLSTIFIGVGFVSVVLSGFLVVNTIAGLLAQQKRQIGVMKVIGASTRQIRTLYLGMVALYGVMALLIAVPAGLGLAYVLLTVIAGQILNFDVLDFHLPLPILLLQVAMALLSPLGAALLPVTNATRMTAREAISDSVQSSTGLIDLLLARISGLPRPLLLSLRNTFRRKARLIMTLITLTLAGALFISVLNVRSSMSVEIDNLLRMLNFDVQLALTGLYQADGAERRAEQVPGVTAAEGWASGSVQRIRPNGTRGSTFTIFGLRHDSEFVDPALEQGRWLTDLDRLTQDDIVLSGELVRDESDIQVGDFITLELDGRERDWRVVGFLRNSQNVAYAHFAEVSRFLRQGNQTGILQIKTAQSDLDFQMAAAAALEAHLDDRDITVAQAITRGELERRIGGNFDILITMLLAMAVLVAAVGGLGLAGTMSLNVMERTREIGVMRAVGATTPIIRRIFLVEGLMIGVLSWLVAQPLSVPGSLAFSTVLGQVVLERALPFNMTVDGPVLWLGIALLIAAAASLMPAQRASRVSVREALSYE
ncbi:MAG: FtsX-like permease family protein [Chloroflexi bacterium]|nr:FtsX-like permease family protein [Chloroflexota bacterium]